MIKVSNNNKLQLIICFKDFSGLTIPKKFIYIKLRTSLKRSNYRIFGQSSISDFFLF